MPATLDKEAVRAANPIERVIPDLLGEHPKAVGGELKVRCCFHDDEHPSLRLNPTKQVWCCDVCNIGGDVFDFVMQREGLTFPDALTFLADGGGIPSAISSHGRHGRGNGNGHAGGDAKNVLAAAGMTFADLHDAPAKRSRAKRIAATYDYKDEHDTLLFQVVRYDKPKNFRQRRPDGKGGWTWNVNGVRHVIYQLPDVRRQLADPTVRREHGLPDHVFIVAGEKDTDRLMTRGLIATTNAGGEGKGKWRAEHAQQVKEAGATRVVILPDNDETGRAHAEAVARSCHAAGLTVTVVALPHVPEKGDVSDFLDRRVPDPLKELLELVAAAPLDTGDEPHAVDLTGLLADVQAFVRSYVVLTDEQATLVTLWIAVTHALEAFDFVAYLHIKSPMPECGKTRLLEVLEALVEHPWLTGRVTAAVLMRKNDAEHPVLLLDESDAAFNGEKEFAEALRGMLNSGFQRSGKASACVGQGANLTYKDFSTFGPKAIAGIGTLPPTVESRAIPVALRRRTKDEPIAKFRRREAWATAAPLRSALAATLRPALGTLKVARPAFPDLLSDRAEDVLEPLLAVADLAGGEWPHRARTAAEALMGYAARAALESDQSLTLELLADIHAIFLAKGNPSCLSTEDLIKALVAVEDGPWATCTKGDKPITPHRLSRMLKAFNVKKPEKMRDGKTTFRGYERAAFTDAFARYLPSKPEQAEQPNKDGHESAKTEVEHEPTVPHAKTAISLAKHCAVPLDPLEPPISGRSGRATSIPTRPATVAPSTGNSCPCRCRRMRRGLVVPHGLGITGPLGHRRHHGSRWTNGSPSSSSIPIRSGGPPIHDAANSEFRG